MIHSLKMRQNLFNDFLSRTAFDTNSHRRCHNATCALHGYPTLCLFVDGDALATVCEAVDSVRSVRGRSEVVLQKNASHGCGTL